MKATNLVYLKDGKAWTDSVALAAEFNKEHKDVLRKIEKQITEYSTEFTAAHFYATVRTVEAGGNGAETLSQNLLRAIQQDALIVSHYCGKISRPAALSQPLLGSGLNPVNDVERGRELSRLMKMQGALKKAHPSVRERVELRIDELLEQTACRFLEVFGQAHPIVKALERASPDRCDPGIL